MTRKNPLVDIIQAEVKIRTQLAVKLSLVIPTDRTGGDSPGGNEPVKKKSKLEYLLYGGRERTQEEKEQVAYEKLKEKAENEPLEGVELSLFKKLEEDFGHE